MPAAESTLVSLPPQLECLSRGASANDWNASICSPHLPQRYTYVGMDAPSGRSSGLALDAYECQSYRADAAPGPHGRSVHAALSSSSWYRMAGMVAIALLVPVAWLLGTFPSAQLVGRAHGHDI